MEILKYKAIILPITFLFIVCLTIEAHPIHVSISNLEYNEHHRSFLVSFRFFTDDFERIIDNTFHVKTGLTSKKSSNANNYIRKYIKKHFWIEANKQTHYMEKIDSVTFESIVTWVYSHVKINKTLNTILINNSLLTDLYDDQKNLLILRYLDTEKGYEFNLGSPKSIINLK